MSVETKAKPDLRPVHTARGMTLQESEAEPEEADERATEAPKGAFAIAAGAALVLLAALRRRGRGRGRR